MEEEPSKDLEIPKFTHKMMAQKRSSQLPPVLDDSFTFIPNREVSTKEEYNKKCVRHFSSSLSKDMEERRKKNETESSQIGEL